jgi:hypothetical protein
MLLSPDLAQGIENGLGRLPSVRIGALGIGSKYLKAHGSRGDIGHCRRFIDRTDRDGLAVAVDLDGMRISIQATTFKAAQVRVRRSCTIEWPPLGSMALPS